MNKKDITDLFCEIVKIDSPSGFEEKMRSYLTDRLRRYGAETVVDQTGNLLANIKGSEGGGGEPFVLSAHMDTVEPGRNIKPQISKGIIKSEGSTILGADNKVAIAAILGALESVNPSRKRPVEIVFSVREETDGGINKFDFKKLKGKTGLVADSSNPIGTIITSSPWIVELKIEILGKSAHAGFPEKGLNALTVASAALSKIKWGRINKETTSNMGLISGGSATNTVPERVFIEGEVRSFSKRDLDRQLKLILNVFDTEVKTFGLKTNIFRKLYCPGYIYKKSDRSVKEIRDAIVKTGLKVQFANTFGGSDANTFYANGIKVVNIGDGTKDSHTVNESVSVENIINLEKLIENYITAN